MKVQSGQSRSGQPGSESSLSPGDRLTSAQTQNAYAETVYPKSVWIVHMLRMLMRAPGAADAELSPDPQWPRGDDMGFQVGGRSSHDGFDGLGRHREFGLVLRSVGLFDGSSRVHGGFRDQ